MAPNIIGSTFLLAETAIANSDANNNNNKGTTATTTTTPATATVAATTTATTTLQNGTCPSATGGGNVAKVATATKSTTSSSSTSSTTTASTNGRVPSQGEPAIMNGKTMKLNKTTDEVTNALNMANAATTQTKKPYVMEIVWFNVFLFVILHSTAFYGLWLIFAENAYVEFLLAYVAAVFGGLGITAGVHRLWSHRAYKAKMPLRIFLMLCQSLAFQNSIYEWTRDHRVHHKFTDTDADPHNSRRGFFFAHMGWLMCRKHPDVKEKGKAIDMSDLERDPVVMFQKKFYFVIMPICCFIIPGLFPYYYMGSSLQVCFFVCSMLRYALSLHGTWLVNSAAHFYGMKPYDTAISSVDSKFVSTVAFGEGWHNYHHVFPWDYKAAELGNYKYNWTTAFLHFMAYIGQAYDLKSVSDEMILKRVKRTGDGSHPSMIDMNNNNTQTSLITDDIIAQLNHENETTMVWGWDDVDIAEDDRRNANILGKKDE